MLKALLDFIPLPWLQMARRIPWAGIGVGIVLVLIAVLGWRIGVWRDGYLSKEASDKALALERRCAVHTACAERLRTLQLDAAGAVTKARQAAQDAIREELARQAADNRAAAERHAIAEAAAGAALKRWEGRYANSLERPDCARWAAEVVPCAISD